MKEMWYLNLFFGWKIFRTDKNINSHIMEAYHTQAKQNFRNPQLDISSKIAQH